MKNVIDLLPTGRWFLLIFMLCAGLPLSGQTNPFGVDGLSLWWKAGEVRNLANTNPGFVNANVFSGRMFNWYSIPTSTALEKVFTQGSSIYQPIFYKGTSSNPIDNPEKFNFNNYVKFSGAQFLQNISTIQYDVSIGLTPTIFIVSSSKDSLATFFAAKDESTVPFGHAIQMKNRFRVQSGEDTYGRYVDLNQTIASHTHYTPDRPAIFGMWTNHSSYTSSILNEFVNTNYVTSNAHFPHVEYTNDFYLGSNGTRGEYINDDIAEVLIYNRILTPLERNCVKSYLAIKYGISLKGNYLNSAGTTIFDYDSQAPFNHNITAVGRDNGTNVDQDLFQKVSRSVNINGFLRLYAGGTAVTATNINNMNATTDISTGFPNNNYFFVADNDLSLNFNNIMVDVPEFNQPGEEETLCRMDRVWKMTRIGSHDKVSILLKPEDHSEINDFRSIVAENAAITQNDQFATLTNGFGGGRYYIFDDVHSGRFDVPHNKFFTFGKVATMPVFSFQTEYCEDETADALPTTSDNGIQGTRTPSSINMGVFVPQEYVFTPNTGQCAVPATVTVTVTARPQTSGITLNP